MASATQLVAAFNACFFSSFNVRLIGGADEPLYLPAKPNGSATVFFRLDYPSSALHEVSHWCIAGDERRLLEDYGYWYESDSRDLQTQQAFEQVEVKPQAVECILHWAAGLPFRVSVDNLSMADYDAAHFERAVMYQVGHYVDSGLPERAKIFSTYLLAQRHPDLLFNEFLKRQYENYCR
ncbi:elongation factor P hydroxylase [Marinomonas sp. M1K-6]|uniref:Elongation factor P hydroxylase n=1 Tax=Marinomonas profundi TaxID=2726122 RepID=A0A847REW6_9GAMM|nr:elongation factor P hydroxylase [Marinomonas profundi]NLQ18810.1 elongation factor P hydroxylase [Marinomonas profundi]UDV02984.1 elongation factor P hydroxylase [Marinomonas profundi]